MEAEKQFYMVIKEFGHIIHKFKTSETARIPVSLTAP